MKKWLVLFTVFLSLISTVQLAEAKKLGGGKSFGKSYSTAPAKPAAAPATPSQAGKSNSATQQQPKKKSGFLGGMLGGLLAGGLLASLFGGFGGGIGGLFSLLIMVLLAVVAFKFFKSMKRMKDNGASGNSRPHYAAGQGHGNSQSNNFEPANTSSDNAFGATEQLRDMPQGDSLQRNSDMLPGNSPLPGNAPLPGNEPLSGGMNQTAGGFSQPAQVPFNLPEGFDMNGFLQVARDHYRTLQQAWNLNQLETIQDYVSPELFNMLRQERASLQGDQHTEVMYVDAELVRADYDSRQAQVSIRFNGRYCDRVEGVEEDINDIWHLERDLTTTNAPWYIVGIEG
ncbi:Tim44 domain-containing protein [Endozoicomonadaceae bacterium StTr2]